MDLNSWQPEDNARRFATLSATALGTFTFIALWLGASWNPFLALLGGAAAGTLTWPLLRFLLRALFR